MPAALTQNEERLPGGFAVRLVRREHRGRTLLAEPEGMFRFARPKCGGVGRARPSPSTAVEVAVDLNQDRHGTPGLGPDVPSLSPLLLGSHGIGSRLA
jgi:hypothetical protein